MFSPLPTPREMSVWDQSTISLGIPEIMLMENAAREALHVLHAEADPLAGKKILLIMGSGNNGGDAACLARHLLDAGADPFVLHSRPLDSYKGAAAQHLLLAQKCGITFASISYEDGQLPSSHFQTLLAPEYTQKNQEWLNHFEEPDIVVDGLLGTGFSGILRQKEQFIVETLNKLARHAFIFSLDIPSGLHPLYGRPQPVAVRANATVSFEAAKPGLILPEAKEWTGRLHVRAIGIPKRIQEEHPASFCLLDRAAVEFGPPSPFLHKGTAGRVLVFGGSVSTDGDLTGAPHLAAQAALRSGAGLVSVVAPTGLTTKIKANCPDIMARPLGSENTQEWSLDLLENALTHLHSCDAAVIGPGLGRQEKTIDFLIALLKNPAPRPPLVLDADALYALAQQVKKNPRQSEENEKNAEPILSNFVRSCDILTPHPGEAATLLGISNAEVQADRFSALKKLQNLAPAVWILKGVGTLIGIPEKPICIAPFAEATLAVGGSGDVLAGCLAALLAQLRHKKSSGIVACLAVALHAEAGHLLAKKYPCRGNTSSETAEMLPEARALLTKKI